MKVEKIKELWVSSSIAFTHARSKSLLNADEWICFFFFESQMNILWLNQSTGTKYCERYLSNQVITINYFFSHFSIFICYTWMMQISRGIYKFIFASIVLNDVWNGFAHIEYNQSCCSVSKERNRKMGNRKCLCKC